MFSRLKYPRISEISKMIPKKLGKSYQDGMSYSRKLEFEANSHWFWLILLQICTRSVKFCKICFILFKLVYSFFFFSKQLLFVRQNQQNSQNLSNLSQIRGQTQDKIENSNKTKNQESSLITTNKLFKLCCQYCTNMI